MGGDEHAAFAERERRAVVLAATRLREAGLPCPVVSVGSTPTAFAARNLDGVTEIRAGVYVFFDLVMAGIGVCAVEDIALSVLTTVIGHQSARGWIVVDAGWTAMSRDRGTATQTVDPGYGLVCDADGRAIPDLVLSSTNQEHGLITARPNSGATLPTLSVGARLPHPAEPRLRDGQPVPGLLRHTRRAGRASCGVAKVQRLVTSSLCSPGHALRHQVSHSARQAPPHQGPGVRPRWAGRRRRPCGGFRGHRSRSRHRLVGRSP